VLGSIRPNDWSSPAQYQRYFPIPPTMLGKKARTRIVASIDEAAVVREETVGIGEVATGFGAVT
jgi:hypothetical protein